MSTRQIRKWKEMHKKDDDLDVTLEDFEPVFAKKSQFRFSELLENSSQSEDNGDHSQEDISSEHEVLPTTSKKLKKKNKKMKKKKQANAMNTISNIQHDETKFSETENFDEIDQVVAEVNKLLGTPKKPTPIEVIEKKPVNNLLKVLRKNIIMDQQTMLDPDDDDEPRHRRQHRPRPARTMIVQPDDKYTYTVKGLKMTLLEIKDGIKYFAFEHCPDYVKSMKIVVFGCEKKYKIRDFDDNVLMFLPDTIEGVLENLDTYYQIEEYDMCRPSLEEIIVCLQEKFHSKFNYFDDTIRLEYKYVENRMFHVALLKYLHMLTNMACHRIALEIAKFLLILDPSDPLAIILIIDTIALRARQHQWFIQLYKQWEIERGAKHLFHMRYSYAMSMFHVATKDKQINEEMLAEADKELQSAILECPLVVLKILHCSSQKNEEIANGELYKNSEITTTHELKQLILLYANFTYPRWREPNVWKWFIKNACAIGTAYSQDPATKKRGNELAAIRCQLFKTYPLEIKRHLNTITPLAKLLVNGAVPSVESSISHNPYPSQGEIIDRNGYFNAWEHPPFTLNNFFELAMRSVIPE